MKKGPTTLVRLTVYPLAALVFIAMSLYIMLISFGYTVSYQDGRLITTKTGIVIIASNPGDAEVRINGEKYRKNTSTLPFFNLKINHLPAGEYDIVISKEGYAPWDGKATVKPGFVSWLNYIILVPLEKEFQPFNFPGLVKKTTISENKNIMLVNVIDDEASIQTIWRIETDSKNKTKIYESNLQDNVEIEPISISLTNDRFLYKEKSETREYFGVREIKADGRSWEITKQFEFAFDSITFSPYSHDELYGLRGVNLHKINYLERTMSASLANNVIGIYPNETEMLIIQNTNQNYGLWRIEQNNNLTNVIKAIPSSKKYQVTYVKDSNYYLVFVDDEKEIIHYSNGAKNPTLTTIAKNAIFFQVSPNGRRIAIKADEALKVYDLDDEKHYEVTKGKEITSANWFSDSSNLIYVEGDEMRMVNFNGFNNELISKIDIAFPAFVSAANHNLYFGKEVENKKKSICV